MTFGEKEKLEIFLNNKFYFIANIIFIFLFFWGGNNLKKYISLYVLRVYPDVQFLLGGKDGSNRSPPSHISSTGKLQSQCRRRKGWRGMIKKDFGEEGMKRELKFAYEVEGEIFYL